MFSNLVIHHINPITIDDLYDNYDLVVDPEFLICMSHNTHQAVTFGDPNHLMQLPRERRKGDTTLW